MSGGLRGAENLVGQASLARREGRTDVAIRMLNEAVRCIVARVQTAI